jgi:hypothetical protein
MIPDPTNHPRRGVIPRKHKGRQYQARTHQRGAWQIKMKIDNLANAKGGREENYFTSASRRTLGNQQRITGRGS